MALISNQTSHKEQIFLRCWVENLQQEKLVAFDNSYNILEIQQQVYSTNDSTAT